ncbi:ribonuclease [Halolactibacillus miurensis]|uniref:Ribonuclease n=1 Tax=Halolactibacillus miurensis TaxID=306541 RepID=A0A1I6T5B8_9BACI|nr:MULTISPECIES: ribonuclease domain-containing protein [Halolactibacillus]GEM05654.1 ribonuclease [Halolactibacillus miurensis]SFS84157.1 ribonuclease [Halolactibacillus miurensis]
MKKISHIILLLFVALGVTLVSGDDIFDIFIDQTDQSTSQVDIEESGHYTSVEAVSTYITMYQALPSNYLTKSEAYDLGWEPDKGNLHDVASGMSIGGDRFYNREGKLPEAAGVTYYEADIDYTGGYRNEKRLVYSNGGEIYYTADHYQTFEEIEVGESQ